MCNPLNFLAHRPLARAALLAAFLPLAARAQFTVAGGSLTITPSTTVSVGGAVDVQSAGTLDNQGSLLLTGNLTNTGTVGPGTGLWQLNGTAPQAVTSTGTGTLGTLEVANAAGAALGAPLTAGTLNLSAGPLRLAAHDLTLTAGVVNSNAATRIVVTNGSGLLRQPVGPSATAFPVGPADGVARPAVLTRSAGTASYGVGATAGALRQGPSGPAYTADAVALRWAVAAPDAVPYTLGVAWAGADELPGFNRALSALARWNGAVYVPVAFSPATGTDPYGTSATGLVAGGTFVVLDPQAPLPVELSRFEARRPAGPPRVLLAWATATEKNNAGFEIQRQDEGQTAFRRVGFVAGAGTTATPRDYAFADANDFAGLSYYRLRQLDADGTATYSPVRAVAGLPAGAAFSLAAYPNPVRTAATLELSGPAPAGLHLALYSADGRRVWAATWPAGQSQQPLPVAGLAQGAYWLRYQAPDGTAGTLPLTVEH